MSEDTDDTKLVEFKLPQDEDVEVSIEIDKLHSISVGRLLKSAIRQYIVNVTGGAHKRWVKAGEKEADKPDFAKIASDAKTRLLEGTIRAMDGEAKAKTAADPVDAIVRTAVVRDVFNRLRKKNPKAKYTEAVAKVGASGIAYLKAQAGDDVDRNKQLTERYLKPAWKMLGYDTKGNPPAETPADEGDEGDDESEDLLG